MQVATNLSTVLVGCGSIARKHIEGIAANGGDFTLVGVYDIDPARAEAAAAAARSTGAGAECRVFTDMEEMASSCRPQAAAIATPSALHAAHAMYWMERGAHIVLEKPVALATADIERIATTRERTGRQIVVAYVLRYAPHVRLLARALEAGRFGRVLHAGLSVYWNRGDEYYRSAPWRGTWEHDGGTLMNQATHGIDLLQWILGGRPVSVHGTLARFLRPIEADDFAAATVTFDGGTVGTVQATVNAYPSNLGTRLVIIGERGTVELSGNGPDALTAWRFPEDEAWREIDAAAAAGAVAQTDGDLAGHAGVYQDLARSIATDREPIASFASSRVSAEIVLGILASHRSARALRFPVPFSAAEMAAL